MRKEEMKLEKLFYIRPHISIIRMEQESFICTSVTHGSSQSTEEEWEEDELDGGEYEI